MRAKKQVSQQARVAKLCKQYCKSLGIAATATSDSFSMGDSVTVKVKNTDPVTYSKIKDECNKYQYGHFDGMNDIYEYSNSNDDIPQTKYMHVNNSFDDDFKQACYAWLKDINKCQNLSELGSDYQTAKKLGYYKTDNNFVSYDYSVEKVIDQILAGNDQSILDCTDSPARSYKLSELFWQSFKTKPNINDHKSNISQHTHTKKGFEMWIVQLTNRVEREEYLSLLDVARDNGGWYSRKWGTTPAGFAFKDELSAHRFAKLIASHQGTPPSDKSFSKPKPMQNSDKLRDMANKLQKQIDDKLRDRPMHTARMMKHAESARMEGNRLERVQSVMRVMADHIDSDTLPEVLNTVTTKKEIYGLMSSGKEMIQNGFHSYYIETGKPRNDDQKTIAAWALLDTKPVSENELELKRLLNEVKLSKIAGYFPTPDSVIDLMIEHAQITENMLVLEPSAGHGAIADKIRDIGADVNCFETNHSLNRILELKGHAVYGDFLLHSLKTEYDAVIMNPPFENQQDIDHVMRAHSHLKKDGRLVAIMSLGFTFRDNKKSVDFRQWLDSVGGTWEELPDKSFKESGTNINTVMVII